MRPSFEKVTAEAGTSWALLNRRLQDGIPFEWHHHPEFELTLTLNSVGHRYIGSDVQRYVSGDLVLIGPNVPHSWCSEEAVDPTQPHVAVVSWFTESWAVELIKLFPELTAVERLLISGRSGLRFSAAVADHVRPMIELMVHESPQARLLTLLKVLQMLAEDREAECLNVDNVGDANRSIHSDPRVHRVLDYIHAHYTEQLSIEDLTAVACVSVSAFHRMFRRHTRTTALEYIARLRIGRACALLMQSHTSIAHIADLVGYASLAFFNRQFKLQKGITPSEFRKKHTSRFR